MDYLKRRFYVLVSAVSFWILLMVCFLGTQDGIFILKRAQRPSLQEAVLRAKGPLKPDDPLLLDLLKEYYLDPPSQLPYNFNNDLKYQSVGKMFTFPIIHQYVKHIFDNQPPGFFVEAGALDGEFLSNTLYLEKELGWNGLLIEANSVNYRHLLLKHRRSWSSNACLTGTPYAREAQFESYEKMSLKNADTSSWLYRANTHEFESFQGDDNMFDATSSKSYERAQCFPIASYFAVLNISVVDFFSLDVQGVELPILETFPWEKVTVRVLVVEHMPPGKSDRSLDQSFIDFVTSKGYRLLDTSYEPDYIFLLESDPYLREIEKL
ncbi:uncharacterized protein LOC143018790 [Oratosquilla oratoria]|uniref:uncharacterized protein LOC143018790 n=1 Tax=Oratosquilla oratoria TaxID=337810 RepID=UPI003F76D5C0